MPEGPEIRLEADRIAAGIAGRRAEDVFFAFPRLKRFEARLSGRKVRSVEPRSKALLVRFAGGWNIYSHNQLYGRWYVSRRDRQPEIRRQLRLAIHTRERSALLYSASEIEVLRDPDLRDHPFLRRLGLDALDATVRPAGIADRLEDRRFRGRSLGGLLLDQGFVGGLGNYLRSEILFVAGLTPEYRPGELDPEQRLRLARAILHLPRRSYRTRGITNDPEIAKRLRDAGEPRRRYRFFVFGRDGLPCHRCAAPIRKGDVAGRRLYRCPRCQPGKTA